MKKLITYCDRCNQEIEAGKVINADERHDLCEGCAREILRNYFKVTVEMLPTSKPEETSGKAVKEEKKESEENPQGGVEEEMKQIDRGLVRNTHPSQPVDKGKAQALRDAGWSVSKIAEEMRCSKATIYNITHPGTMRPKKDWEFVEDDIQREAQPV